MHHATVHTGNAVKRSCMETDSRGASIFLAEGHCGGLLDGDRICCSWPDGDAVALCVDL